MKDWKISSENTVIDEIINYTAYSIGAFMGDGYSRFNVMPQGKGSWYTTEVSCMDLDIIERVQKEFFILSGTKYAITNRIMSSKTILFTIRASKKIVFDFYNCITVYKREVPQEIFSLSDKIKRDFLAGIFDTDGTVKKTKTSNSSMVSNNPRWQLGFSTTIRQVVEEVASLLRLLDVKPGNISEYTKGPYKTVYALHPNIRSFIDSGCYFHCKRKSNRIQDYLNHVVGSETMYAAPLTKGDDIVQACAKA